MPRGPVAAWAAGAALLTLSEPSKAQEAEAQVDAVVVTASRAADAAFNASVLTEEELRSSGGLAEALSAVGDLEVLQPGGRGGFGSVFLRGADPNFTLVMLEGVPLNDATNARGGAANLSDLSALGLERVVVLRGPAAVPHGSGALAGSIDLRMPRGGRVPAAVLQGSVGDGGDTALLAQWRGPLVAGLTGSASVVHEDAGERHHGGAFEGTQILAKLARGSDADGDATAVFMRLSETAARSFPDASGGVELASRRETASRRARDGLLGVRAPLWARGALALDAAASSYRRREQVESPGVAPAAGDPVGVPAGRDDTRFARESAGLVATYRPRPSWTLAAGADVRRESAGSRNSLSFFDVELAGEYDLHRVTRSAFAEAGYETHDLSLSLGVRVDHPDGFDSAISERWGVAYRLPRGGVVLRASGGSAYKAPSFYALANPFVGNPDLNSESGRTLEGSARWAGAGGMVEAGLFRSRYDDLIDFDPGPPPRLANVEAVTGRGEWLTARALIVPDLQADVQVSRTEVRNDATGERLLNRPEHRVTANVVWRVRDGLHWTTSLLHVGSRRDFAVPTGVVALAHYTLVDTRVTWRRADVEWSVDLDNLLDATFAEAVGSPGPGRRVRVSVRKAW